jgi:hypothetical protein
MKKLLIALVVSCLWTPPLLAKWEYVNISRPADGFAEVYSFAPESRDNWEGRVKLNYFAFDVVGVSGFMKLRHEWLELYAGPFIRPTPWLLIGASAGLFTEHDRHSRFAFWTEIRTNRLTAHACLELTEEGFRGDHRFTQYDANLIYWPSQYFGVGTRIIRDAGLGLQVNLKFRVLQLWLAYMPLQPESAHRADAMAFGLRVGY